MKSKKFYNSRLLILSVFTSSIIFLIATASFANPSNQNSANYKGWHYLVNKLKEQGFNQETIDKVFRDPRMPKFTDIPFAIQPAESHSSYQSFYQPKRLVVAKNNLNQYQFYFDQSEKTFGVTRYAVAAILLVETQFGSYTGKSPIFYRLARLASVSDPENLKRNYYRHKNYKKDLHISAVSQRAEYLEKLFLPEIITLLDMSETEEIDVHNIKGSPAGAFGVPQFLPTSYKRFGVDGNGDGKISLYQIPDAIPSVANFLSYYGWSDKLSYNEKQAVIWNYNRSAAYTKTVVDLATLLAGQLDK